MSTTLATNLSGKKGGKHSVFPQQGQRSLFSLEASPKIDLKHSLFLCFSLFQAPVPAIE